MDKVAIKSQSELHKMVEGGKKLAKIKNELRKEVRAGISAETIEKMANDLIERSGSKASFKMVPGYHWATCVNINSGLVHGIPGSEIVFKNGDLVSVDVGIFYKGFHTDTSFSVAINPSYETKRFLQAGKKALDVAIAKVRSGNRIYDISKAIEKIITKAGYSPIKALVGHGVGKNLHEEPQIPCFTFGTRKNSPEILPGMVLAIEVMYAEGKPDVVIDEDGWTISMRDGKISGLFEETVAVTPHGSLVLT